MKYRKNVYQSLLMITQFGINMIVPIFLCTMLGIFLGKKWDAPIVILPFFIIGALAGGKNIYRMSKKIFEQESDRDTRDVKKIK